MSVQNSFLLKYTKRSPLFSKHECKVCKKQFSLPAILAKHLKSQHGEVKEDGPSTTKSPAESKRTRGRPRKSIDKSTDKKESKDCGDASENKVATNSIEDQGENGSGDNPPGNEQTKMALQGQNSKKQLTNLTEVVTRKSKQELNTKNEEKTTKGSKNKTPQKVNSESIIKGRKRQLNGTESESDSPSNIGDRRPKRNRREKRAWSPSNDNSMVLDIKEEPLDFVEEVEELVDEQVENFTCEICNKSFQTRVGLSRHLKVHKEKNDNFKSPVKIEVTADVHQVDEQISESDVVLEENEITDNDTGTVTTLEGNDSNIQIKKDDNGSDIQIKTDVDKISIPKKRRGRTKVGRTYPCDSCVKVFTKPSHLLRHKVKHTGERPWPCDVCGKGFVSKSNMEKHRHLHTGQKKHICDECGKAFALNSYLVRHKMLHQKERDEQMGLKEEPEEHLCSHCGKVFSKANYLRRHIERHVKGKCYECRICGKKFSQRMNRINHEFLHSKTKDYDCHICKKKFALKCYLKVHIQRHIKMANNPTLRQKKKANKEEVDVDSKEKPFKCGQCGKRYMSIKYLQAHEKFHMDPKKFVCEVCGRKFHQKINLQRHMLTHTDPATSKNHECLHCGRKYSRDIYLDRHIKENHTPEGLAKPRLPCQYCEKTFIKPCLLRIHERTHTKEKPYVCSTCGKGFAQEGYMKIHEEIHSDIKKHECSFCGKSFALLYYLTRHLQRHEQAKTFGCDQCSKMFATPKALFDHQRMHTGDLPYKCDLCEKSFPRANSLQRHQKLNACQNKQKSFTPIYYRKPATITTQEHYIEKQEVSCLYICSICRQVFTSQAKLDAHAVEHEQDAPILEHVEHVQIHEEEIPQEAIPVTKEEETIIAEVVNVEENLLGGEEYTTEETVVDAEWLNRLFENAHVESGTDGKIIIVVNRE